MLTTIFEKGRNRRERIIADPDAHFDRNDRVNNVRVRKAKRFGVVAVALMAINQISDNGIISVVGTADRGAEFIFEGNNGTEHEGLAAGALHSAWNFLGQHSPSLHIDSSKDQSGVTPVVTPTTEIPACPTTVEKVSLDGRFVSTAVYELNKAFLPALNDNKLALDALWANYFEGDNSGMPSGAVTANEVKLRQLVSIDNCEIR